MHQAPTNGPTQDSVTYSLNKHILSSFQSAKHWGFKDEKDTNISLRERYAEIGNRMLKYLQINQYDTRQGKVGGDGRQNKTGQQLILVEAGEWLHEIHYVILLLLYIFQIFHKKSFKK